MAKKVALSLFMRIVNIFIEKKWTEIEGHQEALERFGHLLDCLNHDEVELLIELIQKYDWMSYNDYHTSLRKLLILLSDSFKSSNISKLYIFPIIKPKDEDDIKSGHAVSYMLDSITSSIPAYDNIEVIKLKRYDDLKQSNFKLGEGEFLILVDDYVGSGKTLDNTLKAIKSNSSFNNNFAILSIAIQEKTKNQLNSANIPVFSSKQVRRGITDENDSPQLEFKHEIMKKIENRIHAIKGYRYGYEKSEALITLIRTPNNTFPIFWKEISTKNGLLKAPFQRN